MTAADQSRSLPIRPSGRNPREPDAPPFALAARVTARIMLVARHWRLGALPLLGIALFVAVSLAAAIGVAHISPLTTAAVILNQTHLISIPRTWPATDEAILTVVRLPRVVGAVVVGAALGASGTLFQGLLRNPLADPLLLGTSSGAALGATIGFVIPALFAAEWLGFSFVALLAFGGALLAVALVYGLATRGGRTPVVTLLLAGVAVSAMLTAVQTLMIALNQRLGLRIVEIYYWLSGSVNVQGWGEVDVMLGLVAAAIAGGIVLAPVLDTFALGEEMASHLGVPVERCKVMIVALAALLVACAVSLSGLVGFVGLLAPHACRLLLGPRHRLLLPAAALLGAIFVVLADLFARTIVAPSELPLGVVTALVGGPFFLLLLRRFGGGYTW